MLIKIKNLAKGLQSTDLPTGLRGMIRELLKPNAEVEVGQRIHPFELNRTKMFRDLVRQGKISVTFVAEPDDLVTLPTSSGGGPLDTATHRTLPQLIHLADLGGGPFEGFSGAFRQTIGQPFPSDIVWWTSGAMTRRIVDVNVIRDGDQNPIQARWRVYDSSGALVATATDVITYVNGFEAGRTRTMT